MIDILLLKKKAEKRWRTSVTHDTGRRWKGGALPLDQIDRVDAAPSIKKLGTLGLVERQGRSAKQAKSERYDYFTPISF